MSLWVHSETVHWEINGGKKRMEWENHTWFFCCLQLLLLLDLVLF